MAAGRQDFLIEQFATFREQITAAIQGTPIDLTGAVVTMTARTNYNAPDVAFALSSSGQNPEIAIQPPDSNGNAQTGAIVVELLAAQTGSLPVPIRSGPAIVVPTVATYVYDIVAFLTSGDTIRIAYGLLNVSAGVSQ